MNFNSRWIPYYDQRYGNDEGEMTFTRPLYNRNGTKREFWDPIWIKVHKREFFLSTCSMGNVIRHWVYILGTPDEANTFHYTARLTGTKGEEVRYTGKESYNKGEVFLTDLSGRGYKSS